MNKEKHLSLYADPREINMLTLNQRQIENFLGSCNFALTTAAFIIFDSRFDDNIYESIVNVANKSEDGNAVLTSLIGNIRYSLQASTPIQDLKDPTENAPQINRPLDANELEHVAACSQLIIDLAILVTVDELYADLFTEWVAIKNKNINFFHLNDNYQVNERFLLIKLEEFLSGMSLVVSNSMASSDTPHSRKLGI